MTSQVYYRKWRPESFAQLVGQEHVTTTLRQATKLDRVAHSYLFCGPRGSGKTTTARIVAKAVNCLDLQDGDPCNACSICVTINDGRFMDIVELDAASNRGIDEIRDIREKVNFAPVQGRRKVYIIDEAHMLTDAASNAFLKTLEEPPGHVIFILCTTEAHKILGTIVSRCQRFDFRRIPSELIYQRLAEIAHAEGAVVEPEALRLLARYATGSLRDAENLLEQLVVSYSDGVGVAQVEELLGLGHGERWLELVKYLLMGNTSASLGVINQAAWDGTDLRQLHRQSLELLRAAMLLQWGSQELLDLPDEMVTQLQELVGQLPPWRIVRALKLWGEVNMRYDAPSTLPLELSAVEICDDQVAAPAVSIGQNQEPAGQAVAPAPNRSSQTPQTRRSPAPAGSGSARPATQPRERPAPASPPPVSENQPDSSAQPGEPARVTPPAQESAPEVKAPVASDPGAASGGSGLAANWTATVKALDRYKGKKYILGALLRDCKPEAITLDGTTLVLTFTNKTNMERMQEEMDDPNGRKQVTQIVSQFFGATYDFRLTLQAETPSGANPRGLAKNSPLVRVAMGMGARVIEEIVE
ncbi:MAG: DNA polymerase III subunit gamma/tau [Chloroflexi bacterium]|nr:DNA polymerase III subunit gamma/tau [Chloroflexota bacterium]MCI0826049.1 DNA polymerase III subunit gamma/tau [Chloroflexota bacterium]MCI0893540.1 DNA polymerase III subunit gamma/tau [Chloroflexota bacterium]